MTAREEWRRDRMEDERREDAVAEARAEIAARPLSEDERALLAHDSRWGSTGGVVCRMGRRWFWRFRSIEAPCLYPTKTAASAALDAYLEVLRRLVGLEAFLRAVEERGRS